MVASGWVPAERDPEECLGVLLRRMRGSYVTSPDPANHVLLGAVIRLNLVVAMTMRPQMLEGILNSLTPGQTELRFKDGSQLQIIDSLTLAQPSNVKKFQYACVCRHERLVLVWQDDIQNIIPQATRVEERLLSLVSKVNCHELILSNLLNRFGEKQDCLSTFFSFQQDRRLFCLHACPAAWALLLQVKKRRLSQSSQTT